MSEFFIKHKRIAHYTFLLPALLFVFLISISSFPKGRYSGVVIEKRGSGLDRNTDSGKIVLETQKGKQIILENKDDLLMDKRDKYQEFQKNITVGKVYRFETAGRTIGWLGQYPNILSYEEEKAG